MIDEAKERERFEASLQDLSRSYGLPPLIGLSDNYLDVILFLIWLAAKRDAEAEIEPLDSRYAMQMHVFSELFASHRKLSDELEAAKRDAAEEITQKQPKKLWLWKNFVDGKPEYWAFDNPFPVCLNSDDPQTLGEPCGYAVFKLSRVGRTDFSEESVLKNMAIAKREILKQAEADRRDAERFRWLIEDHADKTTRKRKTKLIRNLSVTTYSAACRDIDIAMRNAGEQL